MFLRENGPFDYVIDAANVAYQNQNFNEGRFNYEQVRLVAIVSLRAPNFLTAYHFTMHYSILVGMGIRRAS